MAKRKPPPPPDDLPDDPSGDERIKFPFGSTGGDSAPWNQSGSDESSSPGRPQPGPFDASASAAGESADFSSGDLSASDSAPYDAGSDPFDDLSGDDDLLEDSDLEGIESHSGLDPFGSGASLSSGHRIPNLPPDADPSDDASLDGLTDFETSSDESLVDLQDSARLPTGITDFGPISPSGPLVIVDDDGTSTRFQASIVDDSARLAGAESARAPKRKPRRSTRQRWQEEELDVDEGVPTLSTRRPAATAASSPKSRSWLPWVVALVLALLVGGAQEIRRREDLADQAQRLEADKAKALELAQAEAEAAREKALSEERQRSARATLAAKQAAQGALDAARQAGAREGRRQGMDEGRREAERELEGRLAKARADARARAEAAAKSAAAAELASARKEAAAAAERKAAGALEDALASERKRGAAETEVALASARRRHDQELKRLRDELKAELAAGGSSRAEEQELAAALARDRQEALDSSEGGGSSGGGEVDDWEADLFGDSTPSGGSSGSGSGSSGSGSGSGSDESDDLEALFADEGDEEESSAEDEGENLHPVDRAWAWARENIHGKAGYKNLTHFSAGDSDARLTRHEFRAELSYRDWLWQNEVGSSGVRVVAELAVQVDDDTYAIGIPDSVDDEDRRRPILTTRDFYIALAIDWFEVRGGYQIFSWGTGDLLNPTDNINPIDFSDAFDSRRIPVLAAAVTLDFDFISLEAVAIPTFTRSRLPLRNRRFDALRNSALPVLNPEDPEEGFDGAQFAARIAAHVGGVDLSVSAYRGYSDLPSARLVVIQQPIQALVIDPVYEQIHVAGADFATTLGIFGAEGGLGEFLGGIQVHGEAAHVFTEGDFADDYLQYVAGINYQFVDLILEHDVTLVLEYASEYVTDKATGAQAQANALDRVFKSAVLARVAYEVNERISFELNGALILHGDENAYIHPAAKWNVTDNLQLEVAGDLFWGAEGTFFGQFDKDTRVIFEARIVF